MKMAVDNDYDYNDDDDDDYGDDVSFQGNYRLL